MGSRRIPSDSSVGSVDQLDVGSSAPSSRHTSLTAPSIHEDIALQRPASLDRLQSLLSNTRLDAQRQLSLQPKNTQLKLSTKTREIFSSYGKHGSSTRLSHAIHSFLSSPDTTQDLAIWSSAEADQAAENANQRLTSLRLLAATRAFEAAKQQAIVARLDPCLVDPTTIPGADINDSPLDGRRTLLKDPESLPEVQDLDFNPADITLTFPSNIALPPELLLQVNKILHLLNLQANEHLHHHVTKYITLSSTPLKVQSGLAVLHLGLLEQYSHRAASLFATETSNNDAFAFTQTQRSWLRECYEQMGVGLKGGRYGEMTERERATIARSVGVDEEAVEEWWAYMAGAAGGIRGRKAMHVWIQARELEAMRKAKLEGRW